MRVQSRQRVMRSVRNRNKPSNSARSSKGPSPLRIAVMAAAALAVRAVNSPADSSLPAAEVAAAVPCQVPAAEGPIARPANAAGKAAAVPVNNHHGAEEI